MYIKTSRFRVEYRSDQKLLLLAGMRPDLYLNVFLCLARQPTRVLGRCPRLMNDRGRRRRVLVTGNSMKEKKADADQQTKSIRWFLLCQLLLVLFEPLTYPFSVHEKKQDEILFAAPSRADSISTWWPSMEARARRGRLPVAWLTHCHGNRAEPAGLVTC